MKLSMKSGRFEMFNFHKSNENKWKIENYDDGIFYEIWKNLKSSISTKVMKIIFSMESSKKKSGKVNFILENDDGIIK